MLYGGYNQRRSGDRHKVPGSYQEFQPGATSWSPERGHFSLEAKQFDPLAEQGRRTQAQLDETRGARGIYPEAMERIRSGSMMQGVSNVAGQIAAKPASIDDATKQRMVGVQSDEAVHGHNQSRNRLRSALAAAGALDSPVGMAKEVGMTNSLSAQLQGIRRGGEITQARTNLSDRLASLGGLSSAARGQAGTELAGAAGQVNVLRSIPIPDIKQNPYVGAMGRIYTGRKVPLQGARGYSTSGRW